MSDSQSVVFTQIDPTTRLPLFHFEINNRQSAPGDQPQRALIVAGSLNTVALKPVFLTAGGGSNALGDMQAAAAVYGKGSMMAGAVYGFRLNDPQTELWLLPVPDPSGGTAATGSYAFSGTATAASTLALYVGDNKIQVGVTVGMTAAQLATAAAAAVSASTMTPVTGVASSGTLNLTTKHKGVAMNGLVLGLNYLGAQGGEATPAGITVSVTSFTGGAGTPDLSGLAAAMNFLDFDFVINGFDDATSRPILTQLMSDTAGRWSDIQQLFGGVFEATVDTAANLLTLGESMNDQHTLMWGAVGTPTAPWIVAAAATGAITQRIIAQPNIGHDSIAVAGIMAPPGNPSPLSGSTCDSLLKAGIAALNFDRTGTCRIVRAVTTYQTNNFGVFDNTYMDVGVLYTAMAVLRRLKGFVTQTYGNSLLVDDGVKVAAGMPVVSPKIIRNDMTAEYESMQNDDYWVDNLDAFTKALVVVRDPQNSTRINVGIQPSLVGHIAIFALAMSLVSNG